MGIRENKATVERFDQLTGACELDPLGDRSPGYAARIIRWAIDPRATPRGSREEEIASVRESYVATAVTEIATPRAELFGAEIG